MQKRKFNYYKFGIFCAVVIGVIVLIILGITSLIKNINYKKSYEYKFIQVGYSKEEYDVISKNIEEKNYDKLLEKKYDKEVKEIEIYNIPDTNIDLSLNLIYIKKKYLYLI